MNYADSERLRAFNLLSTSELVLILSVDATFYLPSPVVNRHARMEAAFEAIRRGDDSRPMLDRRIHRPAPVIFGDCTYGNAGKTSHRRYARRAVA